MRKEIQDMINQICDIDQQGMCRRSRALDVNFLPCCQTMEGEMCCHYQQGTDAYCEFGDCPKDCEEYICGFIWQYVKFSESRAWMDLLAEAKQEKRQTIKDKFARGEYSGNPYPRKTPKED